MEMSGQLHALATLPQRKSTWYPLDRRLGGPQSCSGHWSEEKNSQPPPGIKPQNPNHPAHGMCLNYISFQREASLSLKIQTQLRIKSLSEE
jgi:hypothetical protein